jgi:hypothetical protein
LFMNWGLSSLCLSCLFNRFTLSRIRPNRPVPSSHAIPIGTRYHKVTYLLAPITTFTKGRTIPVSLTPPTAMCASFVTVVAALSSVPCHSRSRPQVPTVVAALLRDKLLLASAARPVAPVSGDDAWRLPFRSIALVAR